MGELLKIYKDQEFPAYLFLLKSAKANGLAFIDTMNLDGETNLKERFACKDLQDLNDEQILNLDGEMVCDSPNEFIDKWDGNIGSS